MHRSLTLGQISSRIVVSATDAQRYALSSDILRESADFSSRQSAFPISLGALVVPGAE